MNFDQVFQPIADDLKKVERFLQVSVQHLKPNSLENKKGPSVDSHF